MNTNEYNSFIRNLLRYIDKLIEKPTIRNKDYLNTIKNDIISLGYVPFQGQKVSFLLSFLTADRYIPSNIEDSLMDIKRYQEELNHQPTLEDFYTK
jgi:hypothetical protein